MNTAQGNSQVGDHADVQIRNGISVILGHSDDTVRLINFYGLNTGIIMGRPMNTHITNDTNIIMIEPRTNCNVIVPYGTIIRFPNMDFDFEIMDDNQERVERNNVIGVVAFDRGVEYYSGNEKKTTENNYKGYIETMAPITLPSGTIIKPVGMPLRMSMVGNAHVYIV